MSKFMNILCMLIWVGWIVYGIYATSKGIDVKGVYLICPSLICVLHYIEKLIWG